MLVEILALAIRRDTQIKGIQIENKEVKISQLADDTTCFMRDHSSIKAIFKLLKEFQEISGLKCNPDKTEALGLGPYKQIQFPNTGVRWVTGTFKSLGIYFEYREEQMSILNMDKKRHIMDDVMGLWSFRNLSLLGRILIVKSLVLSKIVYICTSLHINHNVLQDIQRSINNFIWRNGTPKVVFNSLKQHICDGGLKAPCVLSQNKAFKLSWVKIIVFGEESSCKAVIQYLLPFMNLKDIFTSRADLSDHNQLTKVPLFYRDLFDYWNEVKKNMQPRSAVDICNEFLWFNDFIQIDKRCL